MTPQPITDNGTPIGLSVPDPQDPTKGLYVPLRSVTGWHDAETEPSEEPTP